MESAIRAQIEAAVARAQAAPEPDPDAERDSAFAPLPPGLPEREAHLPAARPKSQGGVTLAQCLTRVLEDELRRNPRLTLLGEDLEDPKGDVFGVTRGLSTAFPGRVRNSPLAEATIMGVSIGRALLGDVSVAAIQFVDFIGPALNQLFNEAATLHWRSRGEWNCPLVVLSPCGGYLPGTGPWHSQSNEALFAHVPGLHVVSPSNPGDAAGLLRYALRCGRPVVFLYPKALLHGADDTVEAPDGECVVPFGRARVARTGRDVTVVAWGNAVPLCLQAAGRAADENIQAEVLDLRTLVPWDTRAVLESVRRTGRLLVVHEDNRTCGLGGEVVAEVCEKALERLVAPPRRVARPDAPIPYHYGLELAALPSADDGRSEEHTSELQSLS
jgi:2-oxoisovalerate dehydrogenase E1 component